MLDAGFVSRSSVMPALTSPLYGMALYLTYIPAASCQGPGL